MSPKTIPQSEHFTFHQLADGVWAAIAKSSGLAGSNSGIVDTGDQTVVFDTTLSPTSAIDLCDIAKYLTGRPVTCVLNSHLDRDHVFGNAVFPPQTKIYATTRTSELMAIQTPADILEFKKKWSELQKEWIESAKTAKDEDTRVDFEEGVQFAQKVINTFPQLEPRLPNHTFNDVVEIKGGKRTVKFITFGGGHTDSDALLYLPVERIIFVGDLLVVNNHPALFNGHPQKWLEILAQIKALDPLYLLPGHGELATPSDISQMERYINETLRMAEQNWREGGTAESAMILQPPAFTDGWENSDIFGTNMKFLHEVVQQKD